MTPPRSLRALAAATPFAIAAILAAAPQASAGISNAALRNPEVLDNGRTLGIEFSSAISGDLTDRAIAQDLAGAMIGDWAGGLIESAMQSTPPRITSCRVTATATDPDHATGSVSAVVPAGVTTNELYIPDQAPGTKWGVDDLDHFAVQLTCTDVKSGAQVSKATIDQSETAV